MNTINGKKKAFDKRIANSFQQSGTAKGDDGKTLTNEPYGKQDST
jgi:hypothetical protein